MTTLYRPVLIESAEQAEALPIGTPILEVLTEPGKEERVIGANFIDDSFDDDLTPGGNWHHVALVPIEAEEERARSQINITHLPPPAPQMVPVRLPCPRCGLR